MRLLDLNNKYTDKDTTHSYLDLYDILLKPLQHTATHVLEVGIGNFEEKNGGSLLLWTKYFSKATTYGIDILPISRVLDDVINDPTIKLFCEKDAYTQEFITENLGDTKFDLLLDDGPHTLESQLKFIELYTPLLSETGILMVEDVSDIKHLELLKNKTPEHLKKYIKTFDLRHIKGRGDDIVFAIDRVVRK